MLNAEMNLGFAKFKYKEFSYKNITMSAKGST